MLAPDVPFQVRTTLSHMLRIWYTRTDALQRWTLCGKLSGPWVDELRSSWKETRAAANGLPSVIDLSDVTFIDEAGERLLSELQRAGVEFVAAGVDTKDLLMNLTAKGRRSLRRICGAD